MPQSPKYPVYWQTWGECSWCGFAIPSHYLVMTRKRGWQCLPGNGRTRGCFDGDYDRDDIYFVYPDDEGTRDTAAPLADQNRGASHNIYVLRDSVTGILYAIDFGVDPPYVLVEIALADVDPDIYNGPFDWLDATNGRRVYVANEVLTSGLFITIYCPSAPGSVQTTPTFTSLPPDVEPPIPVPVIVVCPEALIEDLGVDFTESPPALPDGVTVTNYHWDFGDGDEVDTGTINTVHHDYVMGGIYDVVVTVTASSGDVGTSDGCSIQLVVQCVVDQAFLRELFDNRYCDIPNSFLRELFES